MSDKKWEKWAALGGVAFVLFNVVGGIAQGAPPSSDDTNDEVLAWFVDHDTGIKLAALMAALSLLAIVWWFGSLWRRLSAAENGNHRLSIVALAGLVGSGAMFAASTAIYSTVAIQVDEVSPDAAKFFNTLATVLLSFAGPFVAAHLGAVNMLALRAKFLPKWVAIVGCVAAIVFLISSIGTTTDSDAVLLFGFLGFVVWVIWILATSVVIWRTTDAT